MLPSLLYADRTSEDAAVRTAVSAFVDTKAFSSLSSQYNKSDTCVGGFLYDLLGVPWYDYGVPWYEYLLVLSPSTAEGSPSGCGLLEIPRVSQIEKGEHRRSYI